MDFRHAKRNRRLHTWMIALLLTSLALGLNYLASMTKLGIDLTREDRYTLSQETLAWLVKLKRPTDVIITIRESTNQPKIIQRLLLDLSLLLDAFEQATSSFPIHIHYVDVNARKAHNELIEKYGLAEPNLIIIGSGVKKDESEKTVVFRFEDQPSTDSSDPEQVFRSRESKARDAVFDSGLYADWEEGSRNVLEPTKFQGEEVILQGILRVARDREGPDAIYFSRGHGEGSPSDMSRERGYSEMQTFLESRNLRTAMLEPDPNARIPEDAALVVVASPQVPFREQEIARLQTYLSERNGNLLLLLDPVPGLSTTPPAFGFRPLLKEWGLRCHDMLVHDPDSTKFDVFTGDYALRTYSNRNAHPVIAPLMKHGLPIYSGDCRPVEREPNPPEQVEATELIYSSRLSWGMNNWTSSAPPHERNDLLDLPGPVPVAAVAEKKLQPRYDVNVRGGKVAALGSSRLFVNRVLRANAGNKSLLRNLLHWFLAEGDMLDIPPKPIVRYTVNMSEKQFGNLLYSMAAVPGCIVLLGLFVHWLRKDA